MAVVSEPTHAPGRGPEKAPPGPGGRRLAWYVEHAPRITSVIASLLGLLAILDVLGPFRLRSLSRTALALPPGLRAAATAAVLVAGLLLLRIAAGLRRRKRAEWRLAVASSVAVVIADLARDERRPIEAAVGAVLLVALLVGRRRFTAISDRHSRWFAFRVGVQIFLVALVVGMIMLELPAAHVDPAASFGDKLVETLRAMVGFGGTITIGRERYGDLFYATMFTLGLGGAVAVVLLALRSAQPRAELSAEDEQRLRALLQRQGQRDSLGYFALRRDKDVVWSASGKAAITYRVVCGVALVSADPIGDPEAWPGAIEAYRAVVERHGWTPAVMGCSELGATVFRREYGLNALALGDEAILHTARFSLEGRAMRSIRQACTRVQRAGFEASVRRMGELTPADVDELRTAADAWRVDEVERGFSMALSRLGDPSDPDCLIVTVRREGVLYGLLHFVPWGRDGISLDLMRRDRNADNGLNEFMIATTMQACAGLGIEHVSMNFAVFREALERGERIGAGPVSRMTRSVLVLASRWWQIESLYRFNSRFQPEWVPRFISYPAARDLPRITLAALEAEAFVVRPRAVQLLLGRG